MTILELIADHTSELKELDLRAAGVRADRAAALSAALAAGVSKRQLQRACGMSAGSFYKELKLVASVPPSQTPPTVDF